MTTRGIPVAAPRAALHSRLPRALPAKRELCGLGGSLKRLRYMQSHNKSKKCRKNKTSLALDGSVPLIVGKLAERSALRWVVVVMVAAWRDWQDQPDYFMDLHQATEPVRRSTYAMCATDTSSVCLLS